MLKKSPSHPPNPGALSRAFSHAAFSARKNPQRTTLGSRAVSAARRWAGENSTPPVLTPPAALLGGLFEHPQANVPSATFWKIPEVFYG